MRKVPGFVWSILACVICIVVTASVCFLASDKGSSSDKYLEILNIISSSFYTEKDLAVLEDASAAAMVASLRMTEATI